MLTAHCLNDWISDRCCVLQGLNNIRLWRTFRGWRGILSLSPLYNVIGAAACESLRLFWLLHLPRILMSQHTLESVLYNERVIAELTTCLRFSGYSFKTAREWLPKNVLRYGNNVGWLFGLVLSFLRTCLTFLFFFSFHPFFLSSLLPDFLFSVLTSFLTSLPFWLPAFLTDYLPFPLFL